MLRRSRPGTRFGFFDVPCTSRISVCCLPGAIASAEQCHGRSRRGVATVQVRPASCVT
jgi:hypothetical protein